MPRRGKTLKVSLLGKCGRTRLITRLYATQLVSNNPTFCIQALPHESGSGLGLRSSKAKFNWRGHEEVSG